MTTYVVLAKTGEASLGHSSSGSPAWKVVGTTEAQSADIACQWGALQEYEKRPTTGAKKFVAVPERSFQPVEVDIDPNPKASIRARVSA